MFPYLLSIALPLCFFLHQSTLTLAINSPGLYSQQLDHVAVNCGSSGDSTAQDTRKWTGDTGSNYITSLHGSKSKLISSKATDHPYDRIPYATARLSHWPFTYTFRVTPGQKIIRLHFYPASYRGGFKRSEAFFTVKAGPYTLLNNFSASLTVDALGLPSLVKEYCVNIDKDQPLIITFSPSRIGNSDEVYAFVNGIEIISTPAALYHTREGSPVAQIIGKSDQLTIDKSIALETVYRLNVGGSSISSIEDMGMFRDWYEDTNYLLEKSSVKPVTTTIRIKYTSIPPYTAPQKVYQTSWSLVPEDQANKTKSNFTWRLPVDLGFRYLLRLHFCELEYEIKESGKMEFSIFVNEQVAEANGDLIKWSGGNGVAVYKDYVVMMEGDRMEGKRDLLIALRPHNHGWTEPIDATIKGVEVFKLSNHDKNLAGVNPVLLARASTSPKPKKLVFASGGNAIATSVVILLTVLNIIFYQLRSLGENSVGRTLSSSTSEGLCRRFSFAELLSATNNFNDELVIGSGGFGKVYKALIDDGTMTVALKRLKLKSKQGAKEFWTEIEMLSKLRHTHLVSLLGYCDERNEMILVYEFMEHGSLADHLYKTKTKGNGIVAHMSWDQRLNICIGAARGLDYLHTGIRHGIIHRDVKSTNILLDKDWIAKISDFGLCKPGSTSHSQAHLSTDVKGSFGYFDRQYFLTRRLTKKSDVYAFGVVMLEMLCGRPAVDMRVNEEQHSLVLWAKQGIKEDKLDQLIDPSLRDQISVHCVKVFAEVANKCLDNLPKGRPTMADVVVRLKNALASERAVNEQFGENAQGQNRSKGNVSKVFQRTIEFRPLVHIKWKKRKVHDSNGEQALSGVSSTRPILQWKNFTRQFRRSSVESNIPRNFSSSAASDDKKAYLKGKILITPDLRIFSFSELKTATKSFSMDRLLGEGAFGKVYKGRLDEVNGSGLVFAVKKLNPEGFQGLQEWQSEVNFLGRLSHPNLVKLLGYCSEENELLLVYEFMQKGTLENHLFGRSSAVQPLPWGIRLSILIGAARGLQFLHTSEVAVIHRDFKAANILLEECYNARISDFGLAKFGPSGIETHVSTRVVGTNGYAAPEYIITGHLTTKADVYSFGVVLLEMLTGLRVLDGSRPTGKQNLVDWAKPYLPHKRKLINIMDSRLEGKYPSKAAFQIAQVALKCLGFEPETRPSMTAIVETLELAGRFGKVYKGFMNYEASIVAVNWLNTLLLTKFTKHLGQWLHFCELEYEIKESGRMEFSIFVNEQVVEAKGDLIKWSGGNGVAVYKDYVVMMEGDRMEGKRDLLIALRPHNHGWTEPIDATLKGVEVFKLSNPDKNLVGVNPVLLALALTSPKPKKLVFAFGGNAIAIGVVILLTMLNIIVYQLRSLGENSAGRNLSLSTSEGLCRRFSLAELLSATKNFDDELVIGSGGFGNVYKALIDDGATTVALKRLTLKSKQGTKEFWTEIVMLSKLRHTHLVSLLGYCYERNEMILVYEFMEHGTLADHLYKIKTNGVIMGHLQWEQRLNICVGAARGLDYLHTGIRHGIIHRDVKITNILLDKGLIAKISDFGLSKVGSTSHSQTYVSTDVKGTFGYLDPEYFSTRRLTMKSDVFAFGVVMLEVRCGRPAMDMRLEEEQHSLALWAQQCIKEEKLDQLIDPSLREQILPRCLKVFVEVANNCLYRLPKGRPTMADVVVRLVYALASERVVDKQFCENERDDSLPRGDAPSFSSLALYSENTHEQSRSKGNVSKVFQRSIEFLTKVGSNIPRYFLSSAASGGIEACLNWQLILPTPNLRIFSLLELKNATKNFSQDILLGKGGFGNVYKGWLIEKNGSRLVFAVKKWTAEGMQGVDEWLSEIHFLGRYSHPNLVKLLGYCWEDYELLLVYEFIQGSLDNHLFGWVSTVQPLPRNVQKKKKTTSMGHSTKVTGTTGYTAPEYIATGHLTMKSDVYGYSVVLVEMLTGLRAFDPNQASFQIAQLALRCLGRDPKTRPSMKEVVETLERAYRCKQ
ncbi:hypothetical protein RHGRI_028578 [Rhododendron griersonianum]|uniref:non-specific serine/threonine protein kinase n=1 Tax=Rhododendron griersonianum TaxID=479676 RepID=A0AAV6IJR5_9ERIC|nr:hypothetical protein RHGRI_028578 [Rhododendron griersonianum]